MSKTLDQLKEQLTTKKEKLEHDTKVIAEYEAEIATAEEANGGSDGDGDGDKDKDDGDDN